MKIAITIFCLFILSIPTAYELKNERKGEPLKKKWLSMTVRIIIAIGSVWVAAVFRHENFLLDVIKSAVMAFAIFFMFFDYLFNIIFHKKTRVWYSYLSNSPLDSAWGKVNWKWRMGIRAVIFVGSLIYYF